MRRMPARIALVFGCAGVVVFLLAKSSLPLTAAIILSVVLIVLSALFISKAFSRVLEDMRRNVLRISEGDLSRRLILPDTYELAQMADALNLMTARLEERIHRENEQRTQQEAVLKSMVEGVFAVNNEGVLLSLNAAAAELLEVTPEEATGQPLEGIVRNSALQSFVARALESDVAIEEEIVFHLNTERILQTHGTTLRDSENKSAGAVIVMNDVTRLRRLERVRRDFVSNVSHELKTPITSVKGFVETLLDGALDNPEDARHFLTIVQKHADRLHAIIEDLLTLSRLEQDDEDTSGFLELSSLVGPVKEAVQLCTPAADAKNIPLNLTIGSDIQARVNARLLEQGIVNLIDNAIKYSEPGESVDITVSRNGNYVLIVVADHGPGIAPEHIPRLFERFYRIDKARSRNLGGTGLGLAIVRHIVQSQGGQIIVDSKLGSGSKFTIQLPLAKASLTEH